jgi:bifunctional non-homologous end joining protein LigD
MTRAFSAAQSERHVRSKLEAYLEKRDFTKTGEPSGKRAAPGSGFSYVVQKHAASRLHYDFRLELDALVSG